MAEFQFSSGAYCKMILHALKYPYAALCGLLIGEKRKGSNAYRIVDVVPLVHHAASFLVPSIEAALYQVDAFCSSKSPQWHMVGLYHANEELRDTGKDSFVCRVAEKIQANLSEAVLVTIDNKMLSIDATEPCYDVCVYSSEHKSWKTKDKDKFVLENEERSLGVTSACIQMKLQRELVDFDNHMDDPSLDYWNTHLNAKIDSVI